VSEALAGLRRGVGCRAAQVGHRARHPMWVRWWWWWWWSKRGCRRWWRPTWGRRRWACPGWACFGWRCPWSCRRLAAPVPRSVPMSSSRGLGSSQGWERGRGKRADSERTSPRCSLQSAMLAPHTCSVTGMWGYTTSFRLTLQHRACNSLNAAGLNCAYRTRTTAPIVVTGLAQQPVAASAFGQASSLHACLRRRCASLSRITLYSHSRGDCRPLRRSRFKASTWTVAHPAPWRQPQPAPRRARPPFFYLT
jgi:hypothetical protein